MIFLATPPFFINNGSNFEAKTNKKRFKKKGSKEKIVIFLATPLFFINNRTSFEAKTNKNPDKKKGRKQKIVIFVSIRQMNPLHTIFSKKQWLMVPFLQIRAQNG